MDYFKNCHTAAEAKDLWKKLAKELHPDKGGDHDKFIEMNLQYYKFNELQYSASGKNNTEFNVTKFAEFLRQNFDMDNLGYIIEIADNFLKTIVLEKIKKKNPFLGFLANALADGAIAEGKKIIGAAQNSKPSNENKQQEAESNDVEF